MNEKSGPQGPNPKKSNWQSIVEQSASGEAMYSKLLRNCRTHNCLLTGKHAFKRTLPDGSTQYLHAYCDRMDCDNCGARKTAILRSKITDAARKHGLHICYTLTVGGRWSVDEGFDVAQKALKNLKARYKRRFGKPLRYILVKGLSTKKRPHLHLLTDSTDMTKSWIRERWYPATGGQQIHIQENSEDELERLSNYMVLNWLSCHVRGFKGRKLSASQGIDVAVKPRKDKASEGWERVGVSTSQVAKQLPDHQPSVIEWNPPSVTVPPPDCERSEQCYPTDADQGRRAGTGAEGDGTRTSGISAFGGATSTDPDHGGDQPAQDPDNPAPEATS